VGGQQAADRPARDRELKRTEDGGHMGLQAVRYAAMVSAMPFEKAVEGTCLRGVPSRHEPALPRRTEPDGCRWPPSPSAALALIMPAEVAELEVTAMGTPPVFRIP